MSYVIVDVESDGPIPAEYSMVCFGAVVFGENLDQIRLTAHTHNPVDDAKGNAEALKKFREFGLKI